MVWVLDLSSCGPKFKCSTLLGRPELNSLAALCKWLTDLPPVSWVFSSTLVDFSRCKALLDSHRSNAILIKYYYYEYYSTVTLTVCVTVIAPATNFDPYCFIGAVAFPE